MTDYERIAQAIRYLDSHRPEQPDLQDLAQATGLSESHLHHLFSAWAGITPKQFLQCLTFEHARELLRRGQSVLDAALNSGLSGPGRLHDLCLQLEAASPGELKSGGAGWEIQAGFAETPFGLALFAQSPRGICHLAFVEPGGKTEAWGQLEHNWPKASLVRSDAVARDLATRIFRAPGGSVSTNEQHPTRSERSTLRAYVRGTPFQVKVWRALLQVPPGHLVTYGRLATALGDPHAARAVGSAIGRNDLAFLIPCHRVIRETGIIGEYRWGGSVRKHALIAWESGAAPRPAST